MYKLRGAMISSSKTRYHIRFPDHDVYFNANLATREKGKLWWGDIDLTLEREQLQESANELGQELFLFRERDCVDDRAIDFDRAVASFQPVGL